MTAFAFILGVYRSTRLGAGGAQNVMRPSFWGILVATALGVFLIPGNFAGGPRDARRRAADRASARRDAVGRAPEGH
jgi:hypothetical protein